VQARAHIIGIDLPDRLSKGIGRPCVFELLEYLFYDALARAAQYDSATFEERLQYREAIVAHYKHIEAWAEQCPENFENRAALVDAEIARIEGRELEAQPLYEQPSDRRARTASFRTRALRTMLGFRYRSQEPRYGWTLDRGMPFHACATSTH
jgi:hypothetical protein